MPEIVSSICYYYIGFCLLLQEQCEKYIKNTEEMDENCRLYTTLIWQSDNVIVNIIHKKAKKPNYH